MASYKNHNEIGLMDYRFSDEGVTVIQDGDIYKVFLAFEFNGHYDKYDIRVPHNFAELWCKATDPKEVVEYWESSDLDIVPGSAHWHKPTTIGFQVKHSDDWGYGDGMDVDALTDYFIDDSLEDGVYEADPAYEQFWVVSDIHAKKIVGAKVYFGRLH